VRKNTSTVVFLGHACF